MQVFRGKRGWSVRRVELRIRQRSRRPWQRGETRSRVVTRAQLTTPSVTQKISTEVTQRTPKEASRTHEDEEVQKRRIVGYTSRDDGGEQRTISLLTPRRLACGRGRYTTLKKLALFNRSFRVQMGKLLKEENGAVQTSTNVLRALFSENTCIGGGGVSLKAREQSKHSKHLQRG